MIDNNIQKNIFNLKKILSRVEKESKEKDNEIDFIEIMPEPYPLKISTIVFCFKLGTPVYLNIISRFIKVYNINSPDVQSRDGQITFIKYTYSLPRGYSQNMQQKKDKHKKNLLKINKEDPNEPKKKKSNNKFPNQVTMNFVYRGLRNISVFVFSNGGVKMTGLLNQDEGEWVAKRICQLIKDVEITVYNKYQDLPDGKINDFAIVRTNDICQSYRWLEIEEQTGWHKAETLSNDVVQKITKNNLMFNYWHTIDSNFPSFMYLNNIKDYIVNNEIAVFPNEMNDIDINIKLVDTNKLGVHNLKICMINSDFNFAFHMKSDVLRDILTNKYQIDSSYGVQGYNAVKSRYKWNPNNSNSKYPGQCQCETICSGKAKNSNCKVITISVFQNGNSIITGATTIEQLIEAHQFILKVVKDNYEKLYKSKPVNYSKKSIGGRTNPKNKKRKVFILDKDGIQNKQNIILSSEDESQSN